MLNIIATIIFFFTTVLLYFYLVNREKTTHSFTGFFALVYKPCHMTIILIGFVLSVVAYFYTVYAKDMGFLKALVDAELVLWLTAIAYIDFKEKIIPNALIISGIIFWALVMLTEIFIGGTTVGTVIMFSLCGGLVCGAILMIIALIMKSALGMGDVKMFVVIGLLQGLMDTYATLLYSIIIMAVVAIILLVAKKATRKTSIPMAPFVLIGFLLNVIG